MTYLFYATAVWHSVAAYYFLIQPVRTLRSFTIEEPVSLVAKDMMRFLGGINIGYILLALWGANQAPAFPMLNLVLSVANGSQFLIDLSAHQHRVWKRNLIKITLADGFFMVAHSIAFFSLIR